MERLSLLLGGMGCGGCVKNVRKTLDAVPGVTIENVEVGSAVVVLDPRVASRDRLFDALAKAGYPANEKPGAGAKGGHCGINP